MVVANSRDRTKIPREHEGRVEDADELFAQIAPEYEAALARLATGYEADAERRRELLQDIYFALWQSLAAFDGRCSIRTWVYRVAHNTGASHVRRALKRRAHKLISLDEVAAELICPNGEQRGDAAWSVDRLAALVRTLNPMDRQLILLFLEGVGAAESAEITGLSASNVSTKIHRIKRLLARRFEGGDE